MAEVKQRILNAIKSLYQNKKFTFGISIIVSLWIIGFLAPLYIPFDPVPMGRFQRDLPPSKVHILGTDSLGRDVFGLLVYSIKMSLELGLMAGIIAITIGVSVGLISGYRGGLLDDALRTITDTFLVIPTWPILVVVSCMIKSLTVPVMSLLLAVFSWPWAARAIRSQIMSLREREFVNLARLSGEGDLEIMFKEILPNVIPYVGASLLYAVVGAMMAEVGLEVLGIGPQHVTTIGLMLYWAMNMAATVRLIWWWIGPPIVFLIIIFTTLFIAHLGLDEITNPRLKK
ncbi:MAG: ABC transporter permease [Candidatus Bathyarchaeia archaeon]